MGSCDLYDCFEYILMHVLPWRYLFDSLDLSSVCRYHWIFATGAENSMLVIVVSRITIVDSFHGVQYVS